LGPRSWAFSPFYQDKTSWRADNERAGIKLPASASFLVTRWCFWRNRLNRDGSDSIVKGAGDAAKTYLADIQQLHCLPGG